MFYVCLIKLGNWKRNNFSFYRWFCQKLTKSSAFLAGFFKVSPDVIGNAILVGFNVIFILFPLPLFIGRQKADPENRSLSFTCAAFHGNTFIAVFFL